MCSRSICLEHGLRLFYKLVEYVRAARCDCIALSGGIDTSLVALAARTAGLELHAVTVYYSNGLPRDLWYAVSLAKTLNLQHEILEINDDYIASRARMIIECTGRSDYIEVRNDAVFLAALEWSATHSCRCLFTGDGGDELLAGYTFLRTLRGNELRRAQYRLGVAGRYPALELADCIGVKVEAPLLYDEVISIAVSTPTCCLLGDSLEGKHIARLVLEDAGLEWLAWRPKTPAEAGAGTDILTRDALEALTGMRFQDCCRPSP